MAQIDLGEGSYAHMRVTTRNLEKKKFPIWASIPQCSLNRCPVYEDCNPNIKDVGRLVRCKVHRSYMKEVERVILDEFLDKLDQDDLMRFGLQLVPLYSMLCRFKIVEMSIADPVEANARSLVVHPIFKEIRNTIKSINDVWTSLLKEKKLKKPSIPGDGDTPYGSYYEQMTDTAAEEEMEQGLVPRSADDKGYDKG